MSPSIQVPKSGAASAGRSRTTRSAKISERAAPSEEAEPDFDGRIEPTFDLESFELEAEEEYEESGGDDEDITEPNYRITRAAEKKHTGLRRAPRNDTPYEAPPLKLLQQQPRSNRSRISDEALEENARMLEAVLADFGVKGRDHRGAPRAPW